MLITLNWTSDFCMEVGGELQKHITAVKEWLETSAAQNFCAELVFATKMSTDPARCSLYLLSIHSVQNIRIGHGQVHRSRSSNAINDLDDHFAGNTVPGFQLTTDCILQRLPTVLSEAQNVAHDVVAFIIYHVNHEHRLLRPTDGLIDMYLWLRIKHALNHECAARKTYEAGTAWLELKPMPSAKPDGHRCSACHAPNLALQ